MIAALVRFISVFFFRLTPFLIELKSKPEIRFKMKSHPIYSRKKRECGIVIKIYN